MLAPYRPVCQHYYSRSKLNSLARVFRGVYNDAKQAGKGINMPKEYWLSIKEWWGEVPRKGLEMVNIVFTILPIIGGIAGLLLWSRNANPPPPLWAISLIIIGVIISFVLNFLAFHRVRIERDTAKLRVMTIQPSKTETLLEMRSSRFYDITKTLDEMRERLDFICETKPASISPNILKGLAKDITAITGTTAEINKILKTQKMDGKRLKSMQNVMNKKWGNLGNHPFGEQTRIFLSQITGIYKYYHIDIMRLASKDKNYRKLIKTLPNQRRLVLCDHTFKAIEEYLFFLEGYENDYMTLLIGSDYFDDSTLLNAEDKAKLANSKQLKNSRLSFLLNTVTKSIDTFIIETNIGVVK